MHATLRVLLPLLTLTSLPAYAENYIRLNQVGYALHESKQALLLSTTALITVPFRVVNSQNQTVYQATTSANRGAWSKQFPAVYALDFSVIQQPGSYHLEVDTPDTAPSVTFPIASAPSLYQPLLDHALFFYQAQHDGAVVDPRVMNRQPSHLMDQQALVYQPPVYEHGVLAKPLVSTGETRDVSGGWFDAGDYLKFVQTASYTDIILLFTAQQYSALDALKTEARFGLDWLQKMWHDPTQTLYYQVGIGDGNGRTIFGDHDLWRLPQIDDQLTVSPGEPGYYLKYRPVFRAAAGAISPNLAGRLAAAFALCYRLYPQTAYGNQCLLQAEHIFDRAQTQGVRQLLSVSPHSYYPESEWRDDLELGATQLYFALARATALGLKLTNLPHSDPSFYLKQASYWANAYIHSPLHGGDSLNLYDISALAHYSLYQAVQQAGTPAGLAVTPADLLRDLRFQIEQGFSQAQRDPFRLGLAYGGGDATPHALGYALTAQFYDELTQTQTYAEFAQSQRDWVLGRNAWGSSFIVGAGTVFPQCMQHQIANLSGSLDGTNPLVLGATVDGPNDPVTFQGLGITISGARRCPPAGGDQFRQFTGHGSRYQDNVVAWPSVEPADDYTALGILLFARASQP